jgi:ATP-dependent helicase HrpA
MPHLPRYLRALAIRAERAALNPAKDAERARVVAPYVQAAAQIAATPPTTPEGRALAADFHWALEEFRVSTFAQELGTARPVSAKRLDDLLAAVRTAG